jgi:hypothetical protein
MSRLQIGIWPIHSVATTRLSTALVDNVGESNKTYLKTVFVGITLYALLPRQVIDAMITKHGVFTGDDIAKLRAPLSSPLMSLSGLVSHQEKYLLASQRLTRSGQGETPFKHFEMFLDTLKGFRSLCAAQHDPVLCRQSRDSHPKPCDPLPIFGRDAAISGAQQLRVTLFRRSHQGQYPHQTPAQSPEPSRQPQPQAC